MLRYYLDEHLPYLAKPSRKRGIDVLTTQEAERANREIDDPDQLAYASMLGRVIVTKDADFAALAYQPSPHAGIVWLHRSPALRASHQHFLDKGIKV